MLVAFACGIMIFFDDYANALVRPTPPPACIGDNHLDIARAIYIDARLRWLMRTPRAAEMATVVHFGCLGKVPEGCSVKRRMHVAAAKAPCWRRDGATC